MDAPIADTASAHDACSADPQLDDRGAGPPLAGPRRPARLPGSLHFIRALQASFIGVWPTDAYARDLTQVRIGRRHMVVANAPDLVRHVLLDNAANYEKTPIVRRLFAPALGQGLVTAEGAVWKRHRQIMAPMFAARRMAALVPQMAAATRARIEHWRDGAAFDLTAWLSGLTLDIITRTMFGAENAADVATIAAETGTYQRVIRPSLLDFLGAPAWVPRPGTRRALAIGARLTDVINRVIARRRTSGEGRDDLLALLLQASDSGAMSSAEIRDEIATVFTAGHDTTAAALEWIFYLLDRHPQALAQASDEIRDVLRGRPVEADDLDRLPWTRQIVEEAMRLYPPAHTMTRIALAPDRLRDVVVPRGAVVLISPWLLHRNPSLWPEPDRFMPDRFSAGQPEAGATAGARIRYGYIPFGAGPRICIGAGFAMIEIMAVLATILQHWQISLVPGQEVEPVALITMRPKRPLQAIATSSPSSLCPRETLGSATITT